MRPRNLEEEEKQREERVKIFWPGTARPGDRLAKALRPRNLEEEEKQREERVKIFWRGAARPGPNREGWPNPQRPWYERGGLEDYCILKRK